MNYAAYDAKLTRMMVVITIFCVAFLIFGIWATIYSIRTIRRKYNDYPLILIMSLFVLGFAIIFGSHTIYTHAYDIKNQAYIVYEGNFTIPENANKHRIMYIYVNDDKIRLEMDVSRKPGEFSGKVIYSQKSKYALEVYYDE